LVVVNREVSNYTRNGVIRGLGLYVIRGLGLYEDWAYKKAGAIRGLEL
jgi:hypothetical protein